MANARQKRKQKSRYTRGAEGKSGVFGKPISLRWLSLLVVGALVLLSFFLVTQFNPIDRALMAGFAIICIGLGLLIVGTSSAIGNFKIEESSRIAKCFVYLGVLSAARRRPGDILYSKPTLGVIFERILIALILPLGFIAAFMQPKQTWPAIVWVGGGILATFMGWAVCALFGN